MAVTKSYAVYHGKEVLGEYTAVAAAAMLKCTPGTVRTYASYGKALYGEYTFEAVEPDSQMEKPWPASDEWAAAWEKTRQRFLCSGLDLSQIKIRPKSVWR